MSPRIQVDEKRIAEFCRKWKIKEFALFGSVLNEGFNLKSDVDVLVSFEPNTPWGLFEWTDMIEELEEIFGHKVDLVEKDCLRNPFRQHNILNNMKIIFENLHENDI